MSVVTRFAPSPTGFLHIGGARTALFNWLFAHHHGGKFRLRIEDTDRARSTPDAVNAIFEGMSWMELNWDGDVVFQSERSSFHRQIAEKLRTEGNAYLCYCTPEELDKMRAKARAEGRPARYDGRCRNRNPNDRPQGINPVLRFCSATEGEVVVDDKVQGEVRIPAAQLDDLVLLRSDGTPTYMLAVVADDQSMGVTHVIRGVDHLTNAARQVQLFHALGWEVPVFAHIPLIHGPDGRKLSKRHGALAAQEYRNMGYMPAAMRNYLARLGWSHGDDEIFSTDDAVAWFSLEGIGKSSAQFNIERLRSINGEYIQRLSNESLTAAIEEELVERVGMKLTPQIRNRVKSMMPELITRVNTLRELSDNAAFLAILRPLDLSAQAAKMVNTEDTRKLLARLSHDLKRVSVWEASELEEAIRSFANTEGLKLGQVAQPLRVALTGRTASPGIFVVLEVLGREESLGRISDLV